MAEAEAQVVDTGQVPQEMVIKKCEILLLIIL
jgi:hypothetical protein